MKIRVSKKISNLPAAVLILLLALLLSAALPVPERYVSAEDVPGEGPFEMTMLNVGQGLSLVLKADGEYMVYDGGGRESSSYVVSWVKQHGIDVFRYMIASHYDEDHIAGLIGLLKTTSVDTLLCPDYVTDTKICRSFAEAAAGSVAEEEHPEAGKIYQLGNAQIRVLSDDPSAEQENDRSLAVRVTYGDFSVIVTGDASEAEEDAILSASPELDSEVYVAGHHGSSYSGSSEFLAAVAPEYTFISCGAGNCYGHPAEDALDRIRAAVSQIFRSDRQGEVTVYSDGSRYWFSQDPCDDWTPGVIPEEQTEEGSETDADGIAGGYYILNTRSKLIHLPDCDSVKQMKPKNMAKSTKSREELIAEGYRPCKNCSP